MPTMPTLRSKLIRLAHKNPSLRSDILPLLGMKKSAATKTKPLAATMTLELESARNINVTWDISKAHPYPEGAEVRSGDAMVKGVLVIDPAGSLFPLKIPFNFKIQVMESNSGYVGIFSEAEKTPTGRLIVQIMNSDGSNFDKTLFDMLGKLPESPAYKEYFSTVRAMP